MFEKFFEEEALRTYLKDMVEYPYELYGYPKAYTNGLYHVFKYDQHTTPLNFLTYAIEPLFKNTAIHVKALRLSGSMQAIAKESLDRTIQYYTDSFGTPENTVRNTEQYIKVAIFHGTAENVLDSTTALKNIENIQEQSAISRSLTMHTRHAVSVFSRQDTNKTHTILFLTNNTSFEFLIKAILAVFAIVKTLPINTIQKEWDEETQAILNYMYDNAKTDINKIGELLYKLFEKHTDFKTYPQTKVIRQIRRMAEDIQQSRVRNLEDLATSEQEVIQQYYREIIQKQNNVNSMLAELDYLKHNPQNIDMDWLLKNKSIDNYAIAESGNTRFILRVHIKTPLNNVDYTQAKRQYDRVENKAHFYSGHEKEIKALFVDQTHTLIVRQPVELIFNNGTVRVRGFHQSITDSAIGTNKGFPYNPHIESFDCWGTATARMAQLSQYKDIEQLLMLVTACVANLNIGDAAVFDRFCNQFANLHAWKDTPCVIKNETGEIISFKTFLEEIGA